MSINLIFEELTDRNKYHLLITCKYFYNMRHDICLTSCYYYTKIVHVLYNWRFTNIYYNVIHSALKYNHHTKKDVSTTRIY